MPSKPLYVFHEHHARQLHYDLRLEIDHVLKSWAVPKGPPAGGEKRLAIQVEDHALEYGSFEGVIPEGQYGAGRVNIWDTGSVEIIDRKEDKIVFRLEGRKLKGDFVLVRLKPRPGEKGENWLLFRKKAGA